AGKIALKIEQSGSHRSKDRDHRGGLADGIGLECGITEVAGIERDRRRSCARLVGQGMAGIDQALRHRAIDQSGIEMAIAVMRRKAVAERALAGGCRSVDGDDHLKSAPKPCISGTKFGKLVAMKLMSSTFTPDTDPRPMTSADIAMR